MLVHFVIKDTRLFDVFNDREDAENRMQQDWLNIWMKQIESLDFDQEEVDQGYAH